MKCHRNCSVSGMFVFSGIHTCMRCGANIFIASYSAYRTSMTPSLLLLLYFLDFQYFETLELYFTDSLSFLSVVYIQLFRSLISLSIFDNRRTKYEPAA